MIGDGVTSNKNATVSHQHITSIKACKIHNEVASMMHAVHFLGLNPRLLEQLSNVSEVPVHPPNASSYAYEAARRSLERAGYDFESIACSM